MLRLTLLMIVRLPMNISFKDALSPADQMIWSSTSIGKADKGILEFDVSFGGSIEAIAGEDDRKRS